MNTKSLCSCKVRLTQEISRYNIQIDYYQNKTNEAVDALSYFVKRDDKKEATFQIENTRIFNRL